MSKGQQKQRIKGIEPKLVALSEQLQIPYGIFFRRSNKQNIVDIRFCLWKYLNKESGYNQSCISRFFNRHPSTVNGGIKNANFRLEHYNDYKAIYKMITKIFESM